MGSWWRGVIYQIYPRSFQDDTGNGVGDLAGITRRLPYVAALGVDAIWLSPFFTSPMADMGYDVSDYRDVDPLFGTLDDFDALLAEAHALGLKVIIDQVLSHSSDRHPWFEESRQSRSNPRSDWYVWVDPRPDGAPPNNWPSVFGGTAWAWEARRRQYYLHNFLTEQPDLNFHNPTVQDALLTDMKFWLDRGVDGFRLDTVNFYFHDAQLRNNPPIVHDDDPEPVNPYEMQEHIYSKSRPENLNFLKRMRALLDQYDDRAMVGEVGDRDHGLRLMSEYTNGDERLHMAYSFDMLGDAFTPAHFRDTITEFFTAAPDGWPCWSFSNHDVRRHVSRWTPRGTDPDVIAKLAAALLLSFEGSIGIYQGEELGQLETELEYSELTDPVGLRFWPENKGRDGCRTPMVWDGALPHGGFSDNSPWLPVKPDQLARSFRSQSGDQTSVLAFYKAMIAFRNATPALRAGRSEWLGEDENVLKFVRRTDAESLFCCFNLTSDTVSLSRDRDAEIIGPGANATLTGSQIELGPFGFCFLRSR